MEVLLKKQEIEASKRLFVERLDSRIGKGKTCATFGELLQGVLPSDRNFLVTFPIQKYSSAYFEYLEDMPLTVYPSHKKKSLKIAQLILEHFNITPRGTLTIQTGVPEGKGMASSSSDLVATARAVSSYFNHFLTNSLLESFMSEIEPSDGVMYDGCVSYYHKEALLRSYLGSLPSLVILAIDEGGEVDTIEFNSKRKLFTRAEKYEYSILLRTLEAAVRKKDITAIGKISTKSAILNQKLKLNRYLSNFIKVHEIVQSIGVAIAHSGTYIGLLFDKYDQSLNLKLTQAKELFKQNNIIEKPSIYYSL